MVLINVVGTKNDMSFTVASVPRKNEKIRIGSDFYLIADVIYDLSLNAIFVKVEPC